MLGMEIDNSDDGAVLSKNVGKEEVVMKEEQSPQKSPVSPPPSSSSSSPSSDEQLSAKNGGEVEQPRIAPSRLKMVNSSSTTTSLEERANRRASIKKLIRERHLLDKKRENDTLAALIPDSTIQKYFGVNDQDMDPKQFFKNRVKTLAAHKAAGMNLYPNKFPITMSIPDFIQKYEVIKNNQFWHHHSVSLAGRLMDKYSLLSSANVIIYELVGSGGRVQVSAHARLTCLNEDDFLKCHSELKIGDYVGIRGFPGRNGVGKLIIVPYVVIPLSYCLHKMPPMHPNSEATDVWTPGSGRSPYNYVLNNPETRYRRRFLDLTMNLEVRDIYKTRAKAVSYVRHFLENLDFLEVETPMLTMVSGGAVAAARPFVTHHNKLNMKMFMRTTAEFYLKQLVAGGIERVYEIGKQFRNEGIDRTHNPEFTTCEFCMALADYNDLMELTEQMLSGMVKELTGGYKVTYHANGSYNDPIEIDFTPPFRRICLIEELEKKANLSIPKDLLSDESRKCLADACTKFNIICPPPQKTAQLLEKLVGLFVEDTCVNPTFIMDYPEMMSPFAKSHWSKPGLTECFKLFINKFELINAYTQENDPEVHHQRFSDQVKDRQSGDEEAMALDEMFSMALEYGLPPNASCSLSIDKLTMLLTDSQNLKEVILFPAMKPRRRNEPRIQEETEATVINNNVEDEAEAEGFWKILKNARHRLSGFRY